MNLLKLSWKNMMSRPLSTALSLILLTLGVGMISLLMQVNQHIRAQMEKNVQGIDMVVGAKGSPLQLILSAVFHIDAPTGNIDWNEAQQLKRNRLVKSAVPLSYGDTHKGYRIVGTEHAYPALYGGKVKEGKLWEQPFEVTLGATVANALNIKSGDTFTGSHGLAAGGEAHAEHAYRVVGIFEYTNSVMDQLILTATESVWEVHHHVQEEEDDHEQEDQSHAHAELEEESSHENSTGSEEEHEQEAQEITAMLIKFRSPMGLIQMPRMINETTNMQSAVPVFEITRLFSLMGVGIDTLNIIALVIMVVSGLSVFISLYNALRDRQYEMALMRTYGASRWQLAAVVLQEGILLSLSGFVLGMIFSRMGMFIVGGLMEKNYHYEFSGLFFLQQEWWLLLITLGIGVFSSILPAIQVFSINISKTLSDA